MGDHPRMGTFMWVPFYMSDIFYSPSCGYLSMGMWLCGCF